MIHPYIRLLLLILLSLLLSFWGTLAVTGAVLCAMIIVLALRSADVLWLSYRGFKRLRYLLLSIVILYGWYSPGALIWPQLGSWSPSWDGVHVGAERVAMLLAIVVAAQWLIATTSKESIYSALVWWLAPAEILGLPVERFALRLALTLHALPVVRQCVTDHLPKNTADNGLTRWQSAGRSAAAIFAAVSDDSRDDFPAWKPPAALSAPSVAQWLWPLALFTIFYWLHHLVGAQ